jgi:hypothetical protein
MQALQTALYLYEGSVNKISLDDKGITVLRYRPTWVPAR